MLGKGNLYQWKRIANFILLSNCVAFCFILEKVHVWYINKHPDFPGFTFSSYLHKIYPLSLEDLFTWDFMMDFRIRTTMIFSACQSHFGSRICYLNVYMLRKHISSFELVKAWITFTNLECRVTLYHFFYSSNKRASLANIVPYS